jgi:GT2 family glycosyltransferase
MKMPLVYVVILNWNGKACLDKALRSVFRLKYENVQTVIVDNDSNDGSFEQARRNFGKAHFIRNEANVGFARGMNVGIRFAIAHGAEYIWILNNDTEVDERSLSELVSAAEEKGRHTLFSPAVLNPDGTGWFSGGEIRWWRMRAEHVYPGSNGTAPYETGFLSGCAMFFSRESIVKLNLFDERYFLYYEDADLSVRAKDMDMKLFMVPRSRVFHSEESRMNPEKVYWLVFSGLQFFWARSPKSLRPWIFCFTLLRRLKNRRDVSRKKAHSLTVRRAMMDYAKRTDF